jgi:putative hemolysin
MTDKPNLNATSAFVQMMSELTNATPNKVNPAFKSRYVSLDELLDGVKPVLHRHGFALRQVLVSEDGKIGVETHFLHETGATFQGGRLMVKSETLNAQQIGSALTYIKRQSVQTACCISTDGDDDGAASSRQSAQQTKPAAKPNAQTLWFGFVADAGMTESAVAYCIKKGWLKPGDNLSRVPANVVDAILDNKDNFLKAIAR